MNNEMNTLMARKGYLPAADAAAQSTYTTAHIRRLIAQEKLKYENVGGRLYVNRASLVEYLGPVAASATGLDKPLEGEDAAPAKKTPVKRTA